MSQGRSRSRSRSRSPLPLSQNPPTSVRLARIFISRDDIVCEWDGTEPKLGDTLFLYYVIVSDETYGQNIPLDAFIEQRIKKIKNNETYISQRYPIEQRTFRQMRGNNCYYLHKVNNRRIVSPYSSSLYGIEEKRQADLLPNLMRSGRIFQNNDDNSCWYKLEGHDDYTNDYHNFKKNYDFFDVRIIDDAEKFNKYYTPLIRDIPTRLDAHLLLRETGLSSRPKRYSLGGGKTRRKFKVKKRRNRRIRNTMKRRKTALKRRKGRK